MLYIGSLYTTSVPSEPFKLKVEHEIAAIPLRDPSITPYDVQAILLYSITLYWGDELEKAKELLDEAIRMSLDLGINQRKFAIEHGQQDPILEESWRRTWWQLYITDAHIAAGTLTYPFRTSHIEMDVDLPCEEQSYELGVSSSFPLLPQF